MATELRHCVYCRRAGRKCNVKVDTWEEEVDTWEEEVDTWEEEEEHAQCQIICYMCGARGSNESTIEEAEIAWNQNTQIVAETEQSMKNMRALVLMLEEWKDRAIVQQELSQGLSHVLGDAVESMQKRTAELAAKYKNDPRLHRV